MSFDKKRNKWVAQITFQRKNHCLGRFDDKEVLLMPGWKAKSVSLESTERMVNNG